MFNNKQKFSVLRATAALALASAWVSGCVVERTASGDGGAGGSGQSGSSTVGASTTSANVSTSSSGSGGNNTCVSHAECASDEVCVNGSCDYAWGRQFTIWINKAEIPGSDPWNGGAWDAAGGAPDPYAGFLVDGVVGLVTAPVSDDFAPGWYEYANVVFGSPASTLTFVINDEDVSDDDFIAAWEDSLENWLLPMKAYGSTFDMVDENGTRMTISIEPN